PCDEGDADGWHFAEPLREPREHEAVAEDRGRTAVSGNPHDLLCRAPMIDGHDDTVGTPGSEQRRDEGSVLREDDERPLAPTEAAMAEGGGRVADRGAQLLVGEIPPRSEQRDVPVSAGIQDVRE